MVKYRQDLNGERIETEMLTPKLQEFYSQLLSLFTEVDHFFPPTNNSFPPEYLIPSMTHEGMPIDGRTVGGREVTFKNGLWHLITYEERSYNEAKKRSGSGL